MKHLTRHLTPCNIAIVIALIGFTYTVVQSHYDREATREFYNAVMEMNARAVTTATNAAAVLGSIPQSALIEDVPEVTEPLQFTRVRRVKAKRFILPKFSPCTDVVRTTRIGNYEVRYKDINCLNALKEQ